MDIIGLILLVLTYILIGFGFAAGFALFRYAQQKWTVRQQQKTGIKRYRR